MDQAGRQQHQARKPAPSAIGHAGAPAPAPAAGRRHGSRRAPARAAPGEWHRQQQVSRPAPCQQAGRHGSRRAPARAVPGERHQQQQAGAIGHAGRHRPWAIGHGPSAMGHGPCWGTGTSTSSRPAPSGSAWWTAPTAAGQQASRPGAMDQAGGHGSRWPGKPARRDAPSPAQGGRQGKPFSRPIPAPPVGDAKHCPREKAGGKGQETRQKRVCMYEEISLFNKFSICPRLVPALSPLCPR